VGLLRGGGVVREGVTCLSQEQGTDDQSPAYVWGSTAIPIRFFLDRNEMELLHVANRKLSTQFTQKQLLCTEFR
jgi:hypothetical protein